MKHVFSSSSIVNIRKLSTATTTEQSKITQGRWPLSGPAAESAGSFTSETRRLLFIRSTGVTSLGNIRTSSSKHVPRSVRCAAIPVITNGDSATCERTRKDPAEGKDLPKNASRETFEKSPNMSRRPLYWIKPWFVLLSFS